MLLKKTCLVKSENKFVIACNEYQNGIETTGGLYDKEDLVPIEDYVLSITYDSQHAADLPFETFELMFLDDRNIRQKIKEVHFNRETNRYEMEDGYYSDEVTICL